MKVSTELQGVEESMQKLNNFIKNEERAVKDALEYVLREMVNHAKSQAGGNYKDRTGNLRNSISVNMDDMQEYDKDTNPSLLQSKINKLEKPVLKIKGNDYEGAISAGMEYAIWVEIKSGYRVLQGTIDTFEPLIDKYLGDYLSVDKIDIDAVAKQKYLEKYGD
ncbi:HK97 gp10 family phage protein [Halocella sp. SP3-1]|uniref:HK97 gp10 family phage protein n=1 Tax=Halocella sp. SP3-1 TaxID=2382161 RepID=UPI000F765543|nr:HK97 gp10 family phage protein [Halocella sp. SP3-1]AZO96135.1 HK97 gp10 family phage protein [Halocella sp. SP3-1]